MADELLTDKILEDLKNSQLQRDEVKVATLRLLVSEMNNSKIAKGENLSNEDILAVISREIKKRREAAAGFRQGNREESAQKEEAEISVLENYLPQQLSDEELTKLVEESITEVGAASIADMGKVMSMVMGKAAGKAEGSRVSSLVKEKLS